jgi:SpoVK/Ycf46/Vps4 family AAA+-type ATPase
MSKSTIDGLREALEHSPDNIPLRSLLAENLYSSGKYEEAEQEYLILMKLSDDSKYKTGLATVFFEQQNYSACNVILEELLEYEDDNFEVLILYAKALFKEEAFHKAREYYQKALILKPGHQEDELDVYFRNKQGFEEELDEVNTDSRFLEKPDISFKDVGGMDNVKKEIDLKIIKPLQHRDLYKAYGKKIGGGILLYGPPGCGKTYLAKATAGEVNVNFISVGLNEILDMWIGNSEKNLHSIFELARKHAPCILFIDEIDALGASRSDMKQSGGRHLINQFLQELDGISDNNDGVLIIGATNTPWNLDPAFRRPGRFDRIIFVNPPDDESRMTILKLKLKNKPVGLIDYKVVAKKTKDFSGADLDALIDIAIEEKLEVSFEDGVPKPIETKDLVKAAKKHKASTIEWFTTAKNFAMFANDSGLYDEILEYLKIKK